MRFHFDTVKSEKLRRNAKRGIGFEEVQELFRTPYWVDQRTDDPAQFRAIGWVGGRLFSVIFEVREDEEGEFLHLVTLWKSTAARRFNFMKKTAKPTKPVSAETIAQMAERGESISRFFNESGRMVKPEDPIQRINLDLTASMVAELDRAASELNISRQAVIKTLVRQGLDQHYIARRARQTSLAS